MPYAEDCSRERCKWIGCKIGSGKCDRKTAVLHPDFDRNGSSFCIFHTKTCKLQVQAPCLQDSEVQIPRTAKPDVRIFSALTATMPLMIMTIDTTEIRGRMPEECFQSACRDPSQKNAQEYRDQNNLPPKLPY